MLSTCGRCRCRERCGISHKYVTHKQITRRWQVLKRKPEKEVRLVKKENRKNRETMKTTAGKAEKI